MAKPLIWNGNELKTYGDISAAIYMIIKMPEAEGRAEATAFMETYRACADGSSKVADSNVGYISGYFDSETMLKIQDWFGVAHPVFGKSVPTPREAFEAVIKEGKKLS